MLIRPVTEFSEVSKFLQRAKHSASQTVSKFPWAIFSSCILGDLTVTETLRPTRFPRMVACGNSCASRLLPRPRSGSIRRRRNWDFLLQLILFEAVGRALRPLNQADSGYFGLCGPVAVNRRKIFPVSKMLFVSL